MATGKERLCFGVRSLLLVALAICGAIASHALAQSNAPSFDGSRSYPALGGTQSGAAAVATGDFNGDGKPDFVVATPETNSVSVFFNNGDGTFQPAATTLNVVFPVSVAVGDFKWRWESRPDHWPGEYQPGFPLARPR
jgi:hypothetical protein